MPAPTSPPPLQRLVDEQSVDVLAAQLEAERSTRASLLLRHWMGIAAMFGLAVGGAMIAGATSARLAPTVRRTAASVRRTAVRANPLRRTS